MAQERMDDWMEYAREYAKAERELKIEKWVYISIEYRTKTRDRIVLYTYDLPRKLYERRSWIIRWRVARLQCLHPKEDIHPYFSYYDRRTGLSTGFDSALSKLSAAKAQITIAERKEKEYIEYQRANNLFFDETTDEQLVIFRRKLHIKRDNHTVLERQIRSMIDEK
ncbi:hypothetical protein [Bacteroides acidifaciens]|uniref:hypothetical protein n=1 Tax=Bacteroides acidifaciens TaxID=85831 RepID=UPI00259637BA|nr:hypothetical protein [Bacteroides acidifaciens]